MDFLLPVVAQPLGVSWPSQWRDVPQSPPLEITAATTEVLTLDEAKQHLEIATTALDFDPWLGVMIPAARRHVESYLNMTLAPATLEIVFDAFPLERMISVPRPPFNSIVSFTSFDLTTSVESAVSASTYFVDPWSHPGRVILVQGQVWPTSIRWQVGGRLRWKAGYDPAEATTPRTVPARYVAAVKLLLGHWFVHREAAGDRAPEAYPLGFESLLSDRLVSVG